MVNVSRNIRLTINPASAREIYLRGGSQRDHPLANQIALLIPLSGVSKSDAGTLAWIDTAFAQTLATRGFLDAIHAGNLPPPLSASCEHPVDTNLFYQSPSRLAERSVTLIEALGLTERVTELSLRTSVLECPRCGGTSERYSTPQHALATIQAHMSGQISLSAEGPADALGSWARSHGIPFESREVDPVASRARVQIDSLEAGQGLSSRLSAITHSLWRLHRSTLVCVQEGEILTLAKHGSCPTCGYTFPDERTADISRTLRSGGNNGDSEKQIGSRVLSHGRSIRTLLTDPLCTLTSLDPLSQSTALYLALRTSLGNRAAGTLTSALSATELATIAVCRSLADAIDAQGSCVVDIPEPLLRDTSASPLMAIISEVSTRLGVVILESGETRPNESLLEPRSAETGELIGMLHIESTEGLARTYPVRQAQDLTLSDATFSDVESSLLSNTNRANVVNFASTSAHEVTSIPVFSSLRRSKSLLIHRLGLAESFANLFASSVDARAAGLTPKDFILSTSGRSNKNVCEHCDGLGLLLEYIDELTRPLARECGICRGARFINKVGFMSWRGLSLSTLLNTPLDEILPLLRALPRAAEVIICVEALGLTHLPLGMPITLMNQSEQHAILWIQALLTASSNKPMIALVEAPLISLNARQRGGLRKLLESFPRAKHLSIVQLPGA